MPKFKDIHEASANVLLKVIDVGCARGTVWRGKEHHALYPAGFARLLRLTSSHNRTALCVERDVYVETEDLAVHRGDGGD
jgi:hypothetical protein